MSLKKAFMKMGLLEEDVPLKKVEARPAAAAPILPSYQPAAPMVDQAVYNRLDQSIYDMLQKSLQDNKLAGFDYLKFVSAVDEMKATGSSEDKCFKMAFLAAKQLGIDKDSLLKSGQHYLDVVTQDENDFKADCAQFEKSEIASRHTKFSEIEAKLKELDDQIGQLTKDRDNLLGELNAKETSLDSRKKSFQVTVGSVRDAIQSNMAKISQYL